MLVIAKFIIVKFSIAMIIVAKFIIAKLVIENFVIVNTSCCAVLCTTGVKCMMAKMQGISGCPEDPAPRVL